MFLFRLPWKDRKLISEVAKLYCDMAINGEGYDDRIRQFWRISMYAKAGVLSRTDLETICTAMEAFHEAYKKDFAFKDPDGTFRNLDVVIPKVKALLAEKQKADTAL
ncbi:MAG: hypothetical protein IKE48_05535 [Parasporobacterium sp.]|nr:hypothetical protein [Parasporobacterium sp.]